MRKIIGGLVGGALAAAIYIGIYGVLGDLVGTPLLAKLPINTRFIWTSILAGEILGVVFAFAIVTMPKSFVFRSSMIWVLAFGGEMLLGLPAQGLSMFGLSEGGMSGIIVQVIAFGAFAKVLTFVLDQVIDRPLPVWQPLRSANQFKDIRAESH